MSGLKGGDGGFSRVIGVTQGRRGKKEEGFTWSPLAGPLFAV